MDFATLPPEINSGRMYCGPGAESMRDAAAGWDNLATRLSEVAADYRAVTSQLAESHGPACTVMASTAIPYIGWLSAIATLAAQTAIHANAAASAYDSALAATVPPRLIEANRELQRFLAATNCLGQTSQAIADAEADYERMWAADAEAMYAYAHASVDVCMLTPFGPPPGNDGRVPTKSPWALIAAPEVVSTGHQVMSAIPEALDTLSSPLSASLDTSLSPATPALSKLSSLSAPTDVAINHLNTLNKAVALHNAATLLSQLPGRETGGFGCGASIGTLSVPQTWPRVTPRPAASELGWGLRAHSVDRGR